MRCYEMSVNEEHTLRRHLRLQLSQMTLSYTNFLPILHK